MSNCMICDTRCDKRRKVRVPQGESYRFQSHVICDRCHIAVKKKPTPSRRGRQGDRHVNAPDTLTWIAALRRSWAITNDCFRCELSGLKLELEEAHRPLSMTCDHDPPGSDTYLVVAWLINDMKNDHDRDEFYRNVIHLAEIVAAGQPNAELADRFHEDFSSIQYWRRI